MDTIAGGYFSGKTTEEVYDIYEMLATNSQQKVVRGRRTGIHKVNMFSSNLASQLDEMSRKMNMLINRGVMAREKFSFCGVMGHNETNYGMARGVGAELDEVNYMGGFDKSQPRNDPFSHTYNLGWRNHPNFS